MERVTCKRSREHYNLHVTCWIFPFTTCSTPSTGWPLPCASHCSKSRRCYVCYRCRCTLMPALHVWLIETQISAVCRPYKSPEHERQWRPLFYRAAGCIRRLSVVINLCQQVLVAFKLSFRPCSMWTPGILIARRLSAQQLRHEYNLRYGTTPANLNRHWNFTCNV